MPTEEPIPSTEKGIIFSLLLNNDRVKALGVLDVDSLNVAVQLLLGTLLVVTSSGNADTQSVGDALDTVLPNLLVQRGVQTDIRGTLLERKKSALPLQCRMNPYPVHILAACPKRRAFAVVSFLLKRLALAEGTGTGIVVSWIEEVIVPWPWRRSP